MADQSLPPPAGKELHASLDGPSRTIVVEPVNKPVPAPAPTDPHREPSPARRPDEPVR